MAGLITINQSNEKLSALLKGSVAYLIDNEDGLWEPEEYLTAGAVEVNLELLFDSIYIRLIAVLCAMGVDDETAIWWVFRDREAIELMHSTDKLSTLDIATALVNKNENGKASHD